MFRNADEKAREKLRGQLDMPLSGNPDDIDDDDEDSIWGEESQGAAFDAAADAL